MQKLLFFILALLSLNVSGQKSGTTTKLQRPLAYDSLQAYNGYTMIDNGVTSSILVDMHGNIVKAFPFGLAHILKNGDIIGRTNKGLMRFNPDMEVVYSINETDTHHEITSDDNDAVYILSDARHQFIGLSVQFDVIKIYSAEGKLVYTWDLFDHLKQFLSVVSKSPWLSDIPAVYDSTRPAEEYIAQAPERFLFFMGMDDGVCGYEFSHFNSIQVLPQNDISKKIPAFKKGNLLISYNPYSAYGIIDTSTGSLVWNAYLPERTTLHTPLLTSAGTILIFQNSTEGVAWSGTERGAPCLQTLFKTIPPQKPFKSPPPRLWASAAEYDPLTGKLLWEYTGNPEKSVNAVVLGNTQRLPNGNTLISASTKSNGGRVYEVTPQKKIVWEYAYPFEDPTHHVPFWMYRATRLDYNTVKQFLHGFKQ